MGIFTISIKWKNLGIVSFYFQLDPSWILQLLNLTGNVTRAQEWCGAGVADLGNEDVSKP